MTEAITKKDCLTCGLCCVSLQDQDAFCDVEIEDLEKLPKTWVRKNVLFASPFDLTLMAIDGRMAHYAAIKTKWREQTAGPLKGCSACACVALQGNLLSKVKCSIYKDRPQTCRVAVIPGDKTCLQLRQMVREAIEEGHVEEIKA